MINKHLNNLIITIENSETSQHQEGKLEALNNPKIDQLK